MVWNSLTKWTKLNENENWRFFLKAITNFNSYTNEFTVSHKYERIGIYELSIKFLTSGQSFWEIVNITDCKI